MEDLRIRITGPDGQVYSAPVRSSRAQNLDHGYRQDLGLSCQMPINAGQGDYVLKITGLADVVSRVLWWASKPSANVYPTPEEAYANTTNLGMVPVMRGEASFNVQYPSQYYEAGDLREPHVHFALCGPDGQNLQVLTVDLLRDTRSAGWSWTRIFVVLSILLVLVLLWNRG